MFWIYFWEVYIIIHLRKIISYFLNASLWKNSLFKSICLIWNFIKFLLKSIKIQDILLFHWFWIHLILKIESIATMCRKFFKNVFLGSIHYYLLEKSYFIIFWCVVITKFIVQANTFDLKFHQIIVKIHRNLKFSSILLNFTTTTLNSEISKGMRAILKMSIFLKSMDVPLSGDIFYDMCSILKGYKI